MGNSLDSFIIIINEKKNSLKGKSKKKKKREGRVSKELHLFYALLGGLEEV